MKRGEIILSRKELFGLYNYSCSLPTATTIGKRWRKDVHAYRDPPVSEHKHEWVIGEFVEDPNPEMVGIRWCWALDEQHQPHRGTSL